MDVCPGGRHPHAATAKQDRQTGLNMLPAKDNTHTVLAVLCQSLGEQHGWTV